jgi:hypothetical protein
LPNHALAQARAASLAKRGGKAPKARGLSYLKQVLSNNQNKYFSIGKTGQKQYPLISPHRRLSGSKGSNQGYGSQASFNACQGTGLGPISPTLSR